jgi:hypothetical protein
LEESSVSKVATSPTLYADYIKKVKINKAIGEVKGIGSRSGFEMKFPKYTQDTGISGTGNIPLTKREVELTTEIEKAINIRTRFAITRGLWKIPIKEQVIGSEKDLKLVLNEIGTKYELSNVGYSSLPSSMASFKPMYSIISSSTPSKNYSKTSARYSSSSVKSAISSLISSKSSSNSRMSYGSYSGSLSSYGDFSYSPRSYDYYRGSSYVSPPPPKPRSFIISPFELGLQGKIKKKISKKKGTEIMALFPDFTSRAIGIAPKRVGSVKDALREISKIQSGFEVRSGVRLKGYSPIDEKSLFKGIMK